MKYSWLLLDCQRLLEAVEAILSQHNAGLLSSDGLHHQPQLKMHDQVIEMGQDTISKLFSLHVSFKYDELLIKSAVVIFAINRYWTMIDII